MINAWSTDEFVLDQSRVTIYIGATPEIHGYRADLGYRVYVDKALEIAASANSTTEATNGL